MQYSHSRVECFEKCKFKFKMRYLDEIDTIASTEPDNPLIVGTALHTGIEKGVKEAIEEYFMSFPIIDEGHINEAIKLEYLIPKAKKLLPPGEYEVEIQDDDFIGFIDLLAPATVFERAVEVPNMFDIYDFKYSNNVQHYKESKQLHLYKHFFEKTHPGKNIRNLFFVFVPKVNSKQKKTESLTEFRRRILEELGQKEIKIVKIDYQSERVTEWFQEIKTINETKAFEKNPSYLCRYCEYQNFCEKGDSFMLLPKNERRNIEKVEKRVIWIYGAPFSGKTTFANAFPDPLMLNTDGNIKFVDAPYIHIKDEVKVEGRMTKRTAAWEAFKDVVAELEKKGNTFKTIVVDLVEDLYEYCRVYMCGQMGITHESDDSFKAWDKVRTEFLNTLKRLVNLEYENIILISHEDTSKDITKKGGDKITAIKPNLQEKVANKVAGMVDLVARIVADGSVRTFCFKSNEVIFGGGRLKVDAKDIPLDVNALFRVYDEANKNAAKKATRTAQDKPKAVQAEEVQAVQATAPAEAEKPSDGDSAPQEVHSETVTEQPTRRTRRRAETPDNATEAKGAPVEAQDDNTPPWDDKKPVGEIAPQEASSTEATPIRRVRKSRSAE